jgi:protein FAM50
LSFGIDDDEETENTLKAPTPRDCTPADSSAVNSEAEGRVFKKKLGANSSIGLKPRVMTKTALQREAQQAELARQDFVMMRDAVKATEVVIPFVFYDGTNVPGGRCRIEKGEQIWLFLDKARKVGAELGVGGDKSRRDWARVSVDDLMLVRGEVILPHASKEARTPSVKSTNVGRSTTRSTTSCSTELLDSMAHSSTTLRSPPKPPQAPPTQTQKQT